MDGPSDPALEETAAASEPGGEPAPTVERVGRYLIGRKLGAGAMGTVHEAHDPQLDRKIAIKLLHKWRGVPDSAARLLREARAMARLRHPAVVAVYDAGESDGQLFIAMEMVTGETLGAMLRGRSAAALADTERWLGFLVAAGRGLAAAHDAGILHRDFKPDNVLVEADGQVRVGDFGLAVGAADEPEVPSTEPRTEPTGSGSARLTSTGQLVGTPAYMAPEQFVGVTIDARADQFSFCVALHEAVYGVRPFDSGDDSHESVMALRRAVEEQRFRPPPEGSRVPAWLLAALRRGLAADPAERWPSMHALLAELTRRRDSRRWIPIAAAAALALGAAAVWAATRDPAPPASSPPVPAPPVEPARWAPSTVLLLPTVPNVDVASDGGAVVWKEQGRVVLRGLDGRADASIAIDGPRQLDDVVFAGDDRVLIGFADGSIDAWRPGAAATERFAPAGTGRPLGVAWDGRIVVARMTDRKIDLGLFADGVRTSVAFLDGESVFRHGGLSPDRRRLAVILFGADARSGAIVDLTTGAVVAKPPRHRVVGLAWRDDRHLLVAFEERPTFVDELELGPDGLGPPRRVHEVPGGQLSTLMMRAGRVFMLEIRSDPAVRVHGIGAAREPSREISGGRGAIGLAWDPDGAAWLWDSGARQLVHHVLDGAERFTAVPLERKVIAGTRAGDLVILGPGGDADCAVHAVDPATGAIRWQRATSCNAVVRCAGDVAPPCVLLEWLDSERFTVRSIDPATGTPGDSLVEVPIAFPTGFADVALSADGKTLAIVSSHDVVRWRDLATSTERTVELGSGRVPQWIALAPDGAAILTSVREERPSYELLRVSPDGTIEPLLTSHAEWMRLPRISPDGKRVLVSEHAWSSSLTAVDLGP